MGYGFDDFKKHRNRESFKESVKINFFNDLPTRVLRALAELNVRKKEDFNNINLKILLEQKGFSKKSLSDLKYWIEKYNLIDLNIYKEITTKSREHQCAHCKICPFYKPDDI